MVAQDYRALADYIDVVSPMVYHRMCGRPVSWVGEITAHLSALTERPVWPIIQAVDHPDVLPAEEYARALDTAMQPPAAGVIVFTLKGMLEGGRLAVTQARFTASQ